MELSGVRGVWTIPSACGVAALIVASFATTTRLLALTDESLDETTVSGLVAGPTLFAAPLGREHWVQVHPSGVAVLQSSNGSGVGVWSAPTGRRVTLASVSGDSVLLALSGGEAVYLTVSSAGVPHVAATRTFPHEISCVTFGPPARATPNGGMAVDSDGGDGNAAPLLAFVGLWETNAIIALSLIAGAGESALRTLCSESLGGALPPRSIVAAQLDATAAPHVLVGMGDGVLVAFHLNSTAAATSLVELRRVVLGRTPITLTTFAGAAGVMHVFAACDRPTVVFAAPPRPGRASSGKLIYANVDAAHAPSVSAVAALPPAAVDTAAGAAAPCARLVLASNGSLIIGSIDAVQRMHVKAIPLGEQPRRVAHLRASRTVVVATEGPRLSPSISAAAAPEAVEAGALRIFDDASFVPLGAAFELDPHEVVTALAVVSLGGESHIVAGSAYLIDDEEEPSRGRIIVLAVRGTNDAREITLQASIEVSGGVNAFAALVAAPGAPERLVATVNSKVVVYDVAQDGHGSAGNSIELSPIASYLGSILSLYLDASGALIVVGDLMRSVTLLRFATSERGATLDEVAVEQSNNWMTAVALIDGGATVLGAEHFYNIFTAARATDIAAAKARDSESSLSVRASPQGGSTFGGEDDDATRLDVTGEFHTGEFINRFRAASLVMLPRDATEEGGTVAMPTPPQSSSKRARTDDDGAVRMGAAGAAAVVTVPTPRLVFATVSGAVGALLALPPDLWSTLARVQVALARTLPSAGGLSHADWRSHYKEGRVLRDEPNPAPLGILDGDLLEQLLDLPRDAAAAVVAAANADAPPGTQQAVADDVCRAIEELAALH